MRVNCSTCLELLTPADSLVCTPCGHVFHVQCVLQWFESKKNCPQCRHAANEKNIRKIYLSGADAGDQVSADDLQNKLDNAQLKVRTGKLETEKLQTRLKEAEDHITKLKAEVKKNEHSRRKAQQVADDFQAQISFWKEERDEFEGFKKEAVALKKELERYAFLEKVLKSSAGDVNLLLHERGSYDRESRDLATLIVQLKKKLADVKQTRLLTEKKMADISRARENDRQTIKSQSVQLSELKTHNEVVCSELKQMKDSNLSLKEANEELTAELSRLENQLATMRGNGREHPASSRADENRESERENLSLSPEDPAVILPSFKSSVAGVKRKPLSEVRTDLKKPKLLGTNLLHIGVQQNTGQAYDGLGGRSKPDFFQDRSMPYKKSARPVKRSSNVPSSKRERQKQTIDKFFGSFETP